MQVGFVTRREWFDLKGLELRPGENKNDSQEGFQLRAGGGMMSKYLNVRKACPEAHFTDTYDVPGLVMIVEPLTFFGDFRRSVPLEERLDALSKHNGLKFLWAEEQTIFRWPRQATEKILSEFDAVLACNLYQQQLIQGVYPDKTVKVLYTPIDQTLYQSRPKKRQVVAVGKIGLQKNTEAVIHLFEQLPTDVHKIYIGNSGLWGKVRYEADRDLEHRIAAVADEHLASATAAEVAKVVGESLVYINLSIYDVGCLSFLEAAMAGCWCYCWNYHPMFDEYENISRVENVSDGLSPMKERLETENLEPNTALREEMLKKHSFDAFRGQLQRVLGEILISC